MNPEIMFLLASEHHAELARAAAWESLVDRAAAARTERTPADDVPAALRDRAAPERLRPSPRLLPRRA
jgi:hypothetical protein